MRKNPFHIIKPLGYALRPNPPPYPHPPTLSFRCNERTTCTCIMYTFRRSKHMGLNRQNACLNKLEEPLKDEAAMCPCKSDLNIATSCHALLEIIIFN